MNKIEIKNRYTNSVIFSHEVEDNSIKLTLLAAIESKIDLIYADLRNANLSNADLRSADLSNANLSNANLRNANLSNANLSNANLSNANLSNADLSNADLSNADLSNTFGNKKELCSIQIEKYNIAFTKDVIQIGCKQFSYQEWRNFSDEEINEMDQGALDWWKKWKDWLFMTIELSFN